MQDENTVFKIE